MASVHYSPVQISQLFGENRLEVGGLLGTEGTEGSMLSSKTISLVN